MIFTKGWIFLRNFEQFGKRNESIRKQVGLYEFENVEHGIICAICVNPKEHFELSAILYEVNKKHKGVKKGTKGMDFDNYPGRLLHMDEARGGANRFAKSKKNKQTHFQNKNGNMCMVTIEKSEFGQLNDRRYILFCDCISSLPYGHQDLNAITELKDSLNLTPQDLIKYHENNLLRFEQGIIQRNERMRIINAILTQQPVFYKKGTIKRSQFQIKNTTRDFLLKGLWRKICFVMASAGITKYDGKISGNVLVLGSPGSGKTTVAEEMASNSMSRELSLDSSSQ